MASISIVPVSKLMKRTTMNVRVGISGIRMLCIRLYVGKAFIRVACMVLGCRVHFVKEG